MSEKAILVPEGMLEASNLHLVDSPDRISRTDRTLILGAALRWLAENPIVPTPEQHMDISGMVRSQVEHDDLTMWHFWAEWQRRMFLAPEPEIPEAVKDLLYPDPKGVNFDVNHTILEAYRRGTLSHGEK